jgi:hypothetical protein
VEGSAAGGRMVVLRAPRGIWLHVDGSEPPNFYRMQEGTNWVRRAREARTDGNATLARQFAENAVKSDSWNPEGFYLASASASELGDLAAAEEWADRAIAAVGPDERTLLVLGSVCRRLGKPAAPQRLRALWKRLSDVPCFWNSAPQACSGQYKQRGSLWRSGRPARGMPAHAIMRRLVPSRRPWRAGTSSSRAGSQPQRREGLIPTICGCRKQARRRRIGAGPWMQSPMPMHARVSPHGAG